MSAGSILHASALILAIIGIPLILALSFSASVMKHRRRVKEVEQLVSGLFNTGGVK